MLSVSDFNPFLSIKKNNNFPYRYEWWFTYPTATAIRGGSSRPIHHVFPSWLRGTREKNKQVSINATVFPFAARSRHGRPVALKFYFGFESSAQVRVEHAHENAMRCYGYNDKQSNNYFGWAARAHVYIQTHHRSHLSTDCACRRGAISRKINGRGPDKRFVISNFGLGPLVQSVRVFWYWFCDVM